MEASSRQAKRPEVSDETSPLGSLVVVADLVNQYSLGYAASAR